MKLLGWPRSFAGLGAVALHDLQIVGEAVEAAIPEAAIRLQPLRNIPQRFGLEPAGAPLGFASARDESRALKHFQVFRYRREAHLIGLRKFLDVRLARRQPRENSAACRVGKGKERGAETVGGHLY